MIGLIQNSTSRKIDVDDLKSQLASSMRQQRFHAETSSPIRKEKEAILRKGNNTKNSRSRSRGANTHSQNEVLTLLPNQPRD